MENLGNFPILAAVLLFVVLYLLMSNKEGFSSSGMSMSDVYCEQLADVYAYPRITDIDRRHDLRRRICGPVRRKQVDFKTGNYLTINRQLV